MLVAVQINLSDTERAAPVKWSRGRSTQARLDSLIHLLVDRHHRTPQMTRHGLETVANAALSCRELLPDLCPEPKARCILGNGTLDLIRDTIWKLGVDFDRDVQIGVWVAGEDADDLLGDLDETHLGGRGVDLN